MNSNVKVNKYEMDMCTGSILKKLLLFVIPLILSSELQLLFNAADIVVVGKYAGDNALAAVGSNTALINLLTNFFTGFCIGANVLAAKYYASKKYENLTKVVHTAIALSLISGFILTVVGTIFTRQILVLMKTPEGVIDLAEMYLRIYFLGITSMMVFNFGASVLRAVGDTRRPLYYLMISGVLNVCLNLLLVIVFRMGVAGVAIATAVSEAVSAVLVVLCLVREQGPIHFEIKKLAIDKQIFGKMIILGLPASFQGILFSLSNVVIQASVNSFGEVVVAGNAAAGNIEGFVYVAMNAFHQGSLTFTSQNYGASKFDRINPILIKSLICVTVVGIVLGNTAVFFGEPLLKIYTDSPAVVAAGMVRMNVVSKTYALCGVMDVIVGSLRGLGYSAMPMIVSLLGACLLRLIYIFTLFQIPKYHEVKNLYMTYPVSWMVTFLAHVVCFIIVRRKIKKWEVNFQKSIDSNVT